MALSDAVKEKVVALFKKMDLDGDGELTLTEAKQHFKKFAGVAAKAMFKEVDQNDDKSISLEEFVGFFENVMKQKKEDSEEPLYTAEDVIEIIEDLSSGEAWTDCAPPDSACVCAHYRNTHCHLVSRPAQSWTGVARNNAPFGLRQCGASSDRSLCLTFWLAESTGLPQNTN